MYNSTLSTKPAEFVQSNTIDITASLQGTIITVIEDPEDIIQDILIDDDITTTDIQQNNPTNKMDSLPSDPSTSNITAIHWMIARGEIEIEKSKANLSTKTVQETMDKLPTNVHLFLSSPYDKSNPNQLFTTDIIFQHILFNLEASKLLSKVIQKI